MDVVVDGVRAAEQRTETAVGVNEQHSRRVIDEVVSVFAFLFFKVDAESGRQRPNTLERTRDAEIAGTEIAHVPAKNVGRIAFRVDGHEHDARQRCNALLLEGRPRGRKHLQGCRADVGAMRESEEEEVPLPPEHGLVDRRAVMADELERGNVIRARQYHGPGRKIWLLNPQCHVHAGRHREANGEGNDEFAGFHRKMLLGRGGNSTGIRTP